MQLGMLLFRAGFAAACILTIRGFSPAFAGAPDIPRPSVPSSSARLERLSVPFVENRGETDARVALVARTVTGAVYVSRDGELTYAFSGATTHALNGAPPSRRRWAIKERLVDAQVMKVHGAQATDTRIRRFIAGDRPGVQVSKAYEEADFGDAWPGVRVAVRATGEHAEKFFFVAPGADVNRIRIDVEGVDGLTANARGELIATTGIGDLLLSTPVAWQEIDGVRHEVSVRYALLGTRRYGFSLGSFDAQRTVVIDPIVQSTYIGGNSTDQIFAMTVHPVTGDIYVTGQDESTSLFPVSAGAIDGTRAGFSDAFIARLPADLKSFTAVTYFGGAGNDAGSDIKIHPINGDVYVLGSSNSTTLPGTAGAAQPSGSTSGTPFVARLSADLQTLVRTTFYGNGALTASELPTPGLTLVISPASGTLYIAGSGHATTIPNSAGGAITTPSEYFGYISAVAADLASVGQGTYLSGTDLVSSTFVQSMTLDPANGDLVLVAQTNSGAMPTTPGAAQPANPNANDQQQTAAIARFSQQLTSIKALTYYNDAFGHLVPNSIMVAGGDTVIGGSLNSGTTALPGMAGGAIATPYVDAADSDIANAFVVKFTSDLTTIIQGTYVRGDGSATVTRVIYDPASDSFFATGEASGPFGLGGFPALDPGTDTSKAHSFVAQIAPDLKSFVHSNVLSTSHGAVSIARHPISGDLYIAGYGTAAPNTAGGAQPTNQASGGLNAGVITRLTVAGGGPPSAGEIAFGSGAYQTTAGTPGVVVVTRSSGSAGAVSVTVTTSDGTATATDDYAPVTTTVTFADGDSVSKPVSIATTVRSSAQGNKTVNVTLSAVTGGASLGGQSSTVLTIGDPSTPPPPATGTLQFSAAAYTVADNAGAASIGITRSGGSAGAVSVTFSTSNGTGLAGTDYTATSQTVNFADGDAAVKTVNVPVTTHGNVGSSFTVNLTLTAPAGGASLGSPSAAVLTISATTPAPPPASSTVTVNGKGGGGAVGTLEISLLAALVLLRQYFALAKRGRIRLRPVALCWLVPSALGLTAPAAADSPVYYAGFGLGEARSDASAGDIERRLDAAGFPGSRVSLDDHKLGGKVYAGMKFTRYFALEAAYVELNHVRSSSSAQTANAAGFVAAVAATQPYSARGGTLNAAVLLPLTRGVSVFADAGGFVWRGEIDAATPDIALASAKKTGLSAVAGAGIEWAFFTRFALRAEWERYFITRNSMDLATIGLRVNF